MAGEKWQKIKLFSFCMFVFIRIKKRLYEDRVAEAQKASVSSTHRRLIPAKQTPRFIAILAVENMSLWADGSCCFMAHWHIDMTAATSGWLQAKIDMFLQ